MRTETTKRYEKGTLKYWESIGKVFAPDEKISFIPDGIVIVNKRELRRKLDCKYVWVERVLTKGLTENKRSWLSKILSSEWVIVVHGKPNFKTGWEAIRPTTYKRKSPEDRLEDGIYELLQCIKWRKSKFYRKKFASLHQSPFY
jgi:hypothetical protein